MDFRTADPALPMMLEERALSSKGGMGKGVVMLARGTEAVGRGTRRRRRGSVGVASCHSSLGAGSRRGRVDNLPRWSSFRRCVEGVLLSRLNRAAAQRCAESFEYSGATYVSVFSPRHQQADNNTRHQDFEGK